MIPLRDNVPARGIPVVTLGLIAVNVIVFVRELSLPRPALEAMIYFWGVIPARLLFPFQHAFSEFPPGALLTPFTHMFLHGGWLHLIGNMWYLWIFGDNIEDAMGKVRFVSFYLLTGLTAALFHSLTSIHSNIPTIGASGAISGVLGAYLILYPKARVLVLIPLGFFSRLLYIPAMFVLGFWFLLQLLEGALSGGAAGGVAWWAHIGGFLAGMALVGIFKKREVRFFNPRYRPPNQLNDT